MKEFRIVIENENQEVIETSGWLNAEKIKVSDIDINANYYMEFREV